MRNNGVKPKISCDVLIIGAGVVGLSVGVALLKSKPHLKVIISEKETHLVRHAISRNSGVLRAVFLLSRFAKSDIL
jgi:L-2-hydroxyglutarate oxidase